MENRIENSHGTEIPRKSRSLDLKSLYKSKVVKEATRNKNLKRKASADDVNDTRDKKKKKSIKEVSLSSLKNVNSNSKKSLDKLHDSTLSSTLHDSKDLKVEGNQKSKSSIGFNSVSSLSLDNNVIQIPKRKRGLVGRKKFKGEDVVKQQGQSDRRINLVDQASKLSGYESESRTEPRNVECKKDYDDFKENRNNESNSARQLAEEDSRTGHLAVSNCDSSKKKSQRKRSKRKDLASKSKSAAKLAEPLVDNSSKIGNDSHEDDEENLEENAARMLSSRFDPSCTGFPSGAKGTALQSVTGLSFLLSTGEDYVSHGSKSFSGSESPSVDTAGRILRPRKQHKAKGHSRKRRHFYEVFFGDLDAHWVLNRRIKVFWPLDQSWYYGLVNDYDKERKLHHVKYDDRDEEWIDLQNERFKLLLFPSEVPGKVERRKSKVQKCSPDDMEGNLRPRKGKEKRDMTTEDDGCMGSYMDSEPIISWLARSTRRVKSPSRAVKKQKTSSLSFKSVPQILPDDTVNVLNGSNGSLRRGRSEINRNCEFPDKLIDVTKQQKSALESTSCSKDSKSPIVYFRRRFRKTCLELSHTSESNHGSRHPLGSVFPSAPEGDGSGDLEKRDVLSEKMEPSRLMWYTDDAGLLKLTSLLLESGKFKVNLRYPVRSVLDDFFGAENLWLFRAFFLFHHGTLMITWPRVHLEMLFVDNVVGLRFLLFEGCLEQALAFVFLVLSIFRQPNEQRRYVDLQLPATSIRFKLTCFQPLRKQLVFAFYNYSGIKNSKWIYLDYKLKRHCLLTKQLPLSECTYDNIQTLQNGTKHSSVTAFCGQLSPIKGLQKRTRQGVKFMGSSKESAFVNISHSSSRFDEMYRKLPPLALSFTAAPTFFLSLHLKLLMERCLAHISFQDHDSVENLENSGCLMVDDCSSVEKCSNNGSGIILEENLKASACDADAAASDGCFSCSKPYLEAGFSVSSNGGCIKSSEHYQNGNLHVSGSSAGSEVPEATGTDAIIQLQAWQSNHLESDQFDLSQKPLIDRDKSNTGSRSFLNGLSVEIPPCNQFEKSVDGELHSIQQPTDFSCNNGGIIPSPNPTAPRSTWHRNRSNTSSFGYLSHGWSDGKAETFYNGFGNGPKKPRTQVSYSLPFGGYDLNSKQKSIQKGIANKRIRRANEKRLSDVSRGPPRNLEMLSCDANVLITAGDRGWRECGAQVLLELFERNEWKLSVKISGITKYSYKAHQFLQPGSTNRFTHAMMWKGGKDWILEFPDRSQWALFKEMHEECYNRNIRAASVKNIPIPGVRLIEESDDNGTEIAFIRSSSKYFRHVGTDVEMALDPCRVLYDMDSDDEQFILNIENSSECMNGCLGKISEEIFEKTMDMFEKAAYARQVDQFKSDEIEELVAGVGPMNVIKAIYEHWWQKRQKNGMALIRHLQPPLWERYQQQVKEWELAMSKINATVPNGWQERAAPIEKPPMFAFCLKPRGLEVPNKGSKQRSQRKLSVTGHNNASFGEQDGCHSFGRRLNGFAFGDEKVVYPGHSYEYLDDSPFAQTPPRVFSPRDAGGMLMVSDGLDRNPLHRLQRSKSKKQGAIISPNDSQMMATYGHRMVGHRNGVHRWNMGFSEWPGRRNQLEGSQRLLVEQLDSSDLDEFKLRDASGAAQHALNMAKLKREKAQRLLYRADLAIHKAVVALMTAEAIKASTEDSNGDG